MLYYNEKGWGCTSVVEHLASPPEPWSQSVPDYLHQQKSSLSWNYQTQDIDCILRLREDWREYDYGGVCRSLQSYYISMHIYIICSCHLLRYCILRSRECSLSWLTSVVKWKLSHLVLKGNVTWLARHKCVLLGVSFRVGNSPHSKNKTWVQFLLQWKFVLEFMGKTVVCECVYKDVCC